MKPTPPLSQLPRYHASTITQPALHFQQGCNQPARKQDPATQRCGPPQTAPAPRSASAERSIVETPPHPGWQWWWGYWGWMRRPLSEILEADELVVRGTCPEQSEGDKDQTIARAKLQKEVEFEPANTMRRNTPELQYVAAELVFPWRWRLHLSVTKTALRCMPREWRGWMALQWRKGMTRARCCRMRQIGMIV